MKEEINQKIELTSSGFKKLKKDLKFLIEIERPRIIQAIKEAREQGDLSENAEYHAAKDEQGKIEGDILRIETIVRNSSVIKTQTIKSKKNKEIITIGKTVKCLIVDTKEEVSYNIVGSNEINPEKNQISNICAFFLSIKDKKVGDIVKINSIKPYKVKILAISPYN